MKELLKTEPILVKVTPADKRKVVRAARLVSRAQQKRVTPTALFRDLALEGIERVLAAQPPEPADAAA